jgi:hypothetical protein
MLQSYGVCYGNYVEGLEGDFWDILNYVGKDFAETKKDPQSLIITFLVKVFVKVRGYDFITI